jgi:hypothetical protein
MPEDNEFGVAEALDGDDDVIAVVEQHDERRTDLCYILLGRHCRKAFLQLAW